jgi:non-specific serine/threonine protein kinase
LAPGRPKTPRPPALVTLLGPGGTGKTRLALQVGGDLIDEFDHGVWFVDLAPVADPAFVPQAVADVFNLYAQVERTIRDALLDYLAAKALLLILDNCEHVIGACASLCQVLLMHAPGLRILTTSREPLLIPGEGTYPVAPLGLPDPKTPLGMIADNESVRLFVDRAVAAQPSFVLTEQNASVIAEICSRLDGIPLAIELAAARVRAFSVSELARRMDNRLRLLSGSSRSEVKRHQTLAAAIDWSYGLLDGPERRLFRQLAVFGGGCTLDAADQVVGPEGMAFDNLPRLVDKSLIVAEPADGETRYRQLETIREFARYKLDEAGETQAVRSSHLNFYAALAEECRPQLEGQLQFEARRRLRQDIDNLRAALSFALEADPARALQLAANLWLFWFVQGLFVEGRQWTDRALNSAEHVSVPDAVRADALVTLASFALFQGDSELGLRLSVESLAAGRRAMDARSIAMSMHHLGFYAQDHGQPAKADEYWAQGLEIAKQAGDRWMIGVALGDIAVGHTWRGNLEAGLAIEEKSIALAREYGDDWQLAYGLARLAHIHLLRHDDQAALSVVEESINLLRRAQGKHGLCNAFILLGEIQVRQGDYASARAHLCEAIGMALDLGTKEELVHAIRISAALYVASGEPGRAARLANWAEHAGENWGLPVVPVNRPEIEQLHRQLETRLGPERFAVEWEAGRAMSQDEAVALALADPLQFP